MGALDACEGPRPRRASHGRRHLPAVPAAGVPGRLPGAEGRARSPAGPGPPRQALPPARHYQDGGSPRSGGPSALTKMARGGCVSRGRPGSGSAAAPFRPSMAEGAGAGPRLAELLAAGWRLWEEVETGAEPSSGAPAVQDKVRQGLDALQRAAAMVAQLDLFR